MKMMQGEFCLACSNRSRTREAPTPTNISTKSEPEIEKNGTPASPATARASSVLPVPGGPKSSTPLGMRAPSAWNFFGFSRKSLISCNSSTASSTPATSRKVTFGESTERRFARDLDLDLGYVALSQGIDQLRLGVVRIAGAVFGLAVRLRDVDGVVTGVDR